MYKYSHHPSEINKQEYQQQIDDFVRDVSDFKSIVSIYSIGEMGLYGVSDIDLLIVFDSISEEGLIRNIAKKYYLVDTLLFLDISKINDKNYVSHHIIYDLLYGENLNLKFDTENKNLNIIYCWKVCFFSLLRNFYYYKYNRRIYIKNLLSQINDIRYPIYFLKNLGVNKKKYDDFIKNYQDYRSSYFLHQDYKQLEIFLEEAINVSWEIIYDLEKYLPGSGKTTFLYGRFPTIFKEKTKNNYKNATEKKLYFIGTFSRFLYFPRGFNYGAWDTKLKTDLMKIIDNNNNFLNFTLPTFFGRILLLFKKILDFMILRFF